MVAGRNQGIGPKPQVEQSGVDRGWWTKGRGGDVCEHSGAPSRVEKTGSEREALTAIHREALGCLTLNDQVGILGRINTARQLGDNICRDVKRQICADLVWLARKLAREEIRVDERHRRRVPEPPLEVPKDERIDLEGHDTSAALRQWFGERASPGPDIENQVVGRD